MDDTWVYKAEGRAGEALTTINLQHPHLPGKFYTFSVQNCFH